MVTQSGAVAGLLLTGGASRRLGRDKTLVEVGGRTLAERAAGALLEVCPLAVEVGPGRTSLPAVREDPPGSGPLAALAAGWGELRRRGHDGPVLVLAVDMPWVTAALLRHLAARPGPATAIPRADGHDQNLCARYGPDALDRARSMVAAGQRALRDLVASVEVGWVEEPEWRPLAGPGAFADVDTPEDLARLTGEDPS